MSNRDKMKALQTIIGAIVDGNVIGTDIEDVGAAHVKREFVQSPNSGIRVSFTLSDNAWGKIARPEIIDAMEKLRIK